MKVSAGSCLNSWFSGTDSRTKMGTEEDPPVDKRISVGKRVHHWSEESGCDSNREFASLSSQDAEVFREKRARHQESHLQTNGIASVSDSESESNVEAYDSSSNRAFIDSNGDSSNEADETSHSSNEFDVPADNLGVGTIQE